MMKMMKRILSLVLLTLLAMSCAVAETYVDIQSLYNETPDWQAIYFLPHSEDYAALPANYSFDVNLTPIVPNLERFPVLRLKTKPFDMSTVNQADFERVEETVGRILLTTKGFREAVGYTTEFFFDEMEQAENNPFTAEDAAATFNNVIARYFGVDNFRIRGVIGYAKDSRPFGEYTNVWSHDKGSYTVVGDQMFGGVPVLAASYCGTEGTLYPSIECRLRLADEDHYFFYGSALEVVDELYADVPLLPFSRIKEIYEQTLGTGEGKHLVNVVRAELGYKLSLAPGEALDQGMDATFITQPVWMLYGYIPEENTWGSAKLKQYTTETEQVKLAHPRGIELGLEDGYMCIDAQTGEILNPANLGSSFASVYAQIVTWVNQ